MDLSSSGSSITFTENQQGSSILTKLRAQKERGRFCDVVFHVEGKQYLAHRNVLAACSPYFDSMLKMNRVAKEHLTVSCRKHEVFEVLLDYVYTGKIVVDRQTVLELLHLANHFLIAKLKDYCCEFLTRELNVATCFGIKEQADRYGCPALSQAAHYFITCGITEVVKENEVLNFNFAQIEKLLANEMYTLDINEKVQLILRWTKHNLKEREPFFPVLLSFIKWAEVDIEDIYTSLKSNDLYVNSSICLYHLLKALKDNDLDLGFYADILQQLQGDMPALDTSLGGPLAAAASAYLHDFDEDVKPVGPHEDVTFELGLQIENAEVNGGSDLATESPQKECESFNAQSLMAETHAEYICDGGKMNYTPENITAIYGENIPVLSNLSQSSTSKTRGRPHKRKGIPIKMKISKTKLCIDVSNIRPRRSGRPPKRLYSDQLRKKKDAKNTVKHDHNQTEGEEKEDSDDSEARLAHLDDPDCIAKIQSSKNKMTRKRRERIKCSKCFYVGHSEIRLNAHMKAAHQEDQTYTCTLCQFSCQWNREYYRHMKSHFSGPPYKCDFEECEYSSERIQALLYHRMIHNDERPFQCTVCSLKFRTKNNLNTHLRCHTGEKPFKCVVCDRSFATKGTLEQHSVTHSDHRPYLCDMCGFATKYQSHLIAHKRIHTGEVFRCDYPNCNYSTPKRSQLGCHMRIHDSVRSHICSTCARGFVERSHLVRHERIHLEDKPFKCGLCEYSSTRRDKLKEHSVKHHGENASAKVPYKPRRARCPTFHLNTFLELSPKVGTDHGEHKDEDIKPGLQLNVSEPVDEDSPEAGDEGEISINESDVDLMNSAVMSDGTDGIIASTAIQMLSQATTIDTRGLGLLLPTVVAMDSRPQQQQQSLHVGVGLLDQVHDLSHSQLSENPLASSHQPAVPLLTNSFINQHGSIHLQQIHAQQLQQQHQQHVQQQQQLGQHAHSTTDLTGLPTFMGIF